MIIGIAKIFAAIQTGKDVYPPIPITNFGFFKKSRIKEWKKDFKIKIDDKINEKIFFPNTEDDEIISIFRLDKFPKNLMPLLSEIIVGFIFFFQKMVI